MLKSIPSRTEKRETAELVGKRKLHITVKFAHTPCMHSKMRRDDIDFPIIYLLIGLFHFPVEHNCYNFIPS